MTGQVRRVRAFVDHAVALGRIATNPASVVPLLLARRSQWRTDFRVRDMVLSARRADLTAILEFAEQAEYDFVAAMPFPPDPLVLDLGANIGCFAALVLSACARAEVHSVEPSPDTFAILHRNQRRYPAYNWHTHRLAIAAQGGTLMFSEGGASTGRRLVETGRGVAVTAEAFADFVTRVAGDRRIFLCKMDIEGAELPLFAAAAPLEVLARIDHFVIELHGSPDECRAIAQALALSFPHVDTIASRHSTKPLLHAWR